MTGFAPPKGKTATLPNMVTQMLLPSSPMTITWVVTTAANTTIPAGSSRHDLFVLYHANGSVFLTVVWHTTHGAAGKNTEADVRGRPWRSSPPAATLPSPHSGKSNSTRCPATSATGPSCTTTTPTSSGPGTCHATTTEELLTDAHSIGQCASWAHLFQDSLTAEGITSFAKSSHRRHHPGATFVLVKTGTRRVHAQDEPLRFRVRAQPTRHRDGQRPRMRRDGYPHAGRPEPDELAPAALRREIRQ